MRYLPLYILFFVLCVLPLSAHAAETPVQLLTLGSLFGNTVGDLPAFFNRLFNISLFVGATLAVIVIASSGVEYMMSDAVGTVKDAKDRITQAIIGLLMLLSVYIFYDQINPDILKINFALPEVTATGKTPKPVTTTPVPTVREVAASEVIECGGVGLPSCSSVITGCVNRGVYSSITRPSPGVVVCKKRDELVAPDEVIKAETDAIVAHEIATGEYSAVVNEFDVTKLESLDANGQRELVDTTWPTQCEENSNGNATGNEFRIVEGGLGIRYLCVTP